MQFTKPTDIRAKDAVFVNVEVGQTTSIAKGLLCAWDFTDNSAVSGIEMNTRGKRVIVYPTAEAGDANSGTNRAAGFANVDMDGTAANTRGIPYVLQVFGFRDDAVATTDGNSDIIQGGVITPSGSTAGHIEGTQALTLTAAEASKVVGSSFTTIAVSQTAATCQIFIRLM